jgi:putative endonuclease
MKPHKAPADKSWIVYILRCSDQSLYTGATTDVGKRLAAHSQGSASRYTRSRLPVKLLATSAKMNKSEALSLEMKIKKMPRGKKIAALLTTLTAGAKRAC